MFRSKTKKDIFFDSIIYLFVFILGAVTLLPFLYVIMCTFIRAQEYRMFGITWPKVWTLANYRYLLFEVSSVVGGYKITLLVTALGTIIGTLSSTLLAYGLTRQELPGRSIINKLLLFTMFFGGGMIPTYLTVQYLHLFNTIWSMILPMSYSAWYVFIVRTFINGLPKSLEESATIDGATDIVIAFRIIIPLSKPVISTVALFFAVAYWNDWWNAFLYVSNRQLYPLQLVLKDIISMTSATFSAADTESIARSADAKMPTEVMRMTAIVIAVAPILAVYPFVQKYFIRGMLIGSLKG